MTKIKDNNTNEGKKYNLFLIRRTWLEDGKHNDEIIGAIDSKKYANLRFTKIKEKPNGKLVLYYVALRTTARKIANEHCRAMVRVLRILYNSPDEYLNQFEPLDTEDIDYIINEKTEKETLYL